MRFGKNCWAPNFEKSPPRTRHKVMSIPVSLLGDIFNIQVLVFPLSFPSEKIKLSLNFPSYSSNFS